MEMSINCCPQCKNLYSSSLPEIQNQRHSLYKRCGLPLTLDCGHGVCYHCIVSKRSHSRYGTSNKGPDSTTISCVVCNCVSTVSHEAVRNVLAVINCYQLGLLQLNNLAVDLAGENVGFKDENGGLFVPSSPELIVNRPQLLSPPGSCPVHNTFLDYWCYTDQMLLCSECRILNHLGHDHDVVKIADRNKVEQDGFYEAVNETVELVGQMKRTCSGIKEQSERVKSEYDFIIKQMRSHFSDLHSILAAREQQLQHELFQNFQQRTGCLNNAERHLREGYLDMEFRLQKATKELDSEMPPSRAAIVRSTESIRKFNFCKNLVNETAFNMNSVTLSAAFKPNEEYAKNLRHHLVATISSDYQGFSYWHSLLSQFEELKQDKDRQSLDRCISTSPCEPSEKKRARKQPHLNSSRLLAINHYESGKQITARVVHADADRFYIHVQSYPQRENELEEIQSEIERCKTNPAPQLSELHLGQLVAGLFQGLWYRALIEEINFNCKDVAIFFVDYGNRKLTTAESIRLLSDRMSEFPAHAVYCALSDSKSSISPNEPKILDLKVDRVEHGEVGRLHGQEFTLWVTLCPPAVEERQICQPMEPVEITAHKVVRTLPTPPPAEAFVPKRQRFPLSHRRQPTTIAFSPIQSLEKSPIKSLVVPSQSCVSVSPPPVLEPDQENYFRMKVFVSHLNSPGDFYVQSEENHKMYKILTRQLELHFAKSSLLLEQLKEAEFKTIGLVCATNSDEQWNRCLIVDWVDDQTVTVYLLDIGKKLKVIRTQLFRLSQSQWMTVLPLAWGCQLWGVRPTGHATKWSGSSADKMKKAIKKSRALFVQVYYTEEEEIGDTGKFHPIHYVRFFYEYIRPGGPLEFDQILTGCINDKLLNGNRKLCFRHQMLVTVQPTPKRWLPSVSLPPELEDVKFIWIDSDGLIYVHRPSGPTNHVKDINDLINWHYGKSMPTPDDLTHWTKDEPCIALNTEQKWYRAVVVSADDEAKSAFVLFVDYGNTELVAYENMRKSLVCYEYPIQANRCRLSRYPGPQTKPTEDELEMLHDLLTKQKITIRTLNPAVNGSDNPVVDIWFNGEGVVDLKEVFGRLRPSTPSTPSKASISLVDSSPIVLGTPQPTIPMSSVDMNDSIFDVNSSGFSDDVYPIFTFDVFHESKETDVYRPLLIPRRVSLPIRIVSFDRDDFQGVFSPHRHSLNDSPRDWQDQIESYASLHMELQRSAPLFPDFEVLESGSPCACYNRKDEHWHRGKVLGYIDDDLRYVRVELVDLGIKVKLRFNNIKQLPSEYLSLPRHSAKARMIDCVANPVHQPDISLVLSIPKDRMDCFVAFFRKVNEPLQMTLYYKTSEGKKNPAIL